MELKTGNWTTDEQKALVEAYQAGTSVEDLVETFKRSKRSVIGKLVSENAYVAPEKPKAKKKDEGPTKKEILREIEATGFNVEGFDNVTKPALNRLRDFLAA